MTQDLLLEIGTEEIPAKNLLALSQALANNIQTGLQKAGLQHGEVQTYATPRRLAVLIKNLSAKQNARLVERKGPAVNAAFDANNNPTPALQGFARSCNTTIENLQQVDTTQGAWFIYRFEETGKDVFELMPEIINKAISDLPIPKPMRWGNESISFIRPVHWIVLMYGEKVIPATVLGQASNNITYGHRFLAPQAITIKTPENYAAQLKNAFVIADFAERQTEIKQQIKTIEAEINADIGPSTLFDEVTGLVEWPQCLLANFDKTFLTVPQEALIAAMNDHQKSFPLRKNTTHELLPHFITVSNLVSKDPKEVIRGNERVMRARLADAKFFYEQDLKSNSEQRLDALKKIIFQAGLGTIFDKSQRLVKLVEHITQQDDKAVKDNVMRAAVLCKSDLVSNMVGEFPELQGIMGYYYALQENESSETATAIQQHYWPRFAGDKLPESAASAAVALSDRLDSLVGIFGINQIPTGDKDPFGLRRAAVGVVRILIEKKLSHDLTDLLSVAYQNYHDQLPNKNTVAQVHDYILERLRAWYQEQNITADTLAAVLAVHNHIPTDIDKRVHAVQTFRQLPEAASLAAANKRVSNLLTKSAELTTTHSSDTLKLVNSSLFQNPEEHALYQAIIDKSAVNAATYEQQLISLASLKQPVDDFFDRVLVMEEDEKLRHNRLALVAALRQLFLAVADISLLQV